MSLLKKSIQIKDQSFNPTQETIKKSLLKLAENLRFSASDYLSLKDNGLLHKAFKIIEKFDEPTIDKILQDEPTNDFDIHSIKDFSDEFNLEEFNLENKRDIENFLFENSHDLLTSSIQDGFRIYSEKKINNEDFVFNLFSDLLNSKSKSFYFKNIIYSLVGYLSLNNCSILIQNKSELNSNEDFLCYSTNTIVHEKLYNIHSSIFQTFESGLQTIKSEKIKEINGYFSNHLFQSETQYGYIISFHVPNDYQCILVLEMNSDEEILSIEDEDLVYKVVKIIVSSLKKIESLENHYLVESENNRIKNLYKILQNSLSLFSKKSSLDELIDEAIKNFKQILKVNQYSLLLLDNRTNHYSIFTSTIFSPETIQNFELKYNSEIVNMISNLIGYFEIIDPNEQIMLRQFIPSEELSLCKKWIMIPLLYQNLVLGIFIIHESIEICSILEKEIGLLSSEIFSLNIFNNLYSQKILSEVHPIRQILKEKITYVKKEKKELYIILLKMIQVDLLIYERGTQFFIDSFERLRKIIFQNISSFDEVVRFNPEKILIILSNKEINEISGILRKIEIQVENQDLNWEFKQNSIATRIYCFPKDFKTEEEILLLLQNF